MTPPWPRTPPSPEHRAAFSTAVPRPFWLDALPGRDPHPRLEDPIQADLCIVGGGFTGLWAALHAKRESPERRVVVLDAQRCGQGASGRNGGFLDASLTHGLSNGLNRFADELAVLERLGRDNFAALKADLDAYGIDADYEPTGLLTVALEQHEVDALDAEAALLRRYGYAVDVLDRAGVQGEVASPTYLGGLWVRSGTALVDPGKLADGLRRAAIDRGVEIYEQTRVSGVVEAGAGIAVRTDSASVQARRVLLATSAYPPLLTAMRRYIAPVYDYVLVTEPLSAAQQQLVGWKHRQGLDDGGNQFHYYRRTADGRILFGGYDAVYRYRGPVDDRLDDHEPSFARLAQHFFTTFPQLEGLRFSHRWGGAIDTCSRFAVFFGTAFDGRLAYATGYTGLGVGASRFGARVALDLLDGRTTEATRLRFVRTRPVPFPPEPLRSAVIQLTRNRLAAADRREGRRGLWLGLLDRLGLGFDT